MLRHANKALKGHRLPRIHSRGYSNRPFGAKVLSRNPAIVASSAAVAAAILWYSSRTVVYNDFSESAGGHQLPVVGSVIGENDQTGVLVGIVFGSNKSNVLSPETPNINSIRTPSIAQWLENVALRDLALHESHAACIDACGNVYQWGDNFFGSATETHKPKLTLRGKNITSLQLTESRLFALSASGKVYVLSTTSSQQHLPTGAPTPSSTPWWSTGWMWGEEEAVSFAQITPQEKLAWGETFISISAGQDHLLALTSAGRTFAHPITKNANTYGQLGFRKFDISDPSSDLPTKRLAVELIPKSIADPYLKASAFARPLSSSISADVDDKSIKFCDKLFEIPALKGIKVSQVATGGRSSYVRTSSGNILGWGANEFGQIGLGSDITLDTITVPTEIVVWKTTSGRTSSRCLRVSAGGDLACFIVERVDASSAKTVDLFLTGNGRWGGLGNNIYSNARGTPVRAKNISGLLEYNDETHTLQPIPPHDISISPTGHILLTLDTTGSESGGRDLIVWGKNHDHELGNGKKGSLPVPTCLEKSDGERFMLRNIRAKEVRDLEGKVWKRGINVEQRAVAGYGNSIIYWRIN